MYKTEMSETMIQTSIMEYLAMFPSGQVLRYKNNPIIRVIKGREVPIRKCNRFAPKGMTDIIFFWNSIAYFIEVKRESEYKWLEKHYDRIKHGFSHSKREVHAKNQINFIEDMVNRVGCRGFFTYSLDDCIKKLSICGGFDDSSKY